MKLTLALICPLVAAAPSAVLETRQSTTLCKKYDYWSGNGYECLNNLWGDNAATSGQQCTYVDGSSSSGVKFRSTWTWQGAPDNVKSFIYCGRQFPKGRLISSIPSMQTSVSWSYSTQNLRANVAYDVFTATDPNHSNSSGDYELMIWLARLGGVYPIGKSTGTVTVAGRSWDLWVGMNGQMRVYSFVAASPVTTFSADLKLFFNHLQTTQNYPASKQNLIVFQIGTEAFTGGPATIKFDNWAATIG
jgi:xyloglucan-specific endo-beta-1,4-glucanase